MATPRIEDSNAPNDYYRQIRPSAKKCDRDIPILSVNQAGGRAYEELSTTSTSCYPGAPRVCEQALIARACELRADALILLPSPPEGSPPGASSQSSSTMSARVVRWKVD